MDAAPAMAMSHCPVRRLQNASVTATSDVEQAVWMLTGSPISEYPDLAGLRGREIMVLRAIRVAMSCLLTQMCASTETH